MIDKKAIQNLKNIKEQWMIVRKKFSKRPKINKKKVNKYSF